jgi:hypothetical protein
MAEGSEKLPNLPTESFSRESFYEDRLDGRDSSRWHPLCRGSFPEQRGSGDLLWGR